LQVYRSYTLSLAYDLAQTKQGRAFSDHSDMVGRRLGFVPLPLAVVLIRVLRPCFGTSGGTLVLSIIGFVALTTFRTLNSILLLGRSCAKRSITLRSPADKIEFFQVKRAT
jgi:hypothetical protein